MSETRPALTSLADWLVARSELLCRIAAYTSAALVCAPFFYHLAHGSKAFLGLLEDDYFYYATVADNLATLGKLTYDGATITNGFHPLWLVLVWILRAVFGRFGTPFYVALTCVFFVAACLTFELARRFARSLGASAAAAPAIAAVYSMATAHLFTMGMECDLALPLLLWLLAEVAAEEPAKELTARRAAKLGLLASFAVLARLDSAILVGMLVGAWLLFARPSLAGARRVLVPFCAGGALVPAYALANLIAFGSVMPMSAIAKRLIVVHRFSVGFVRAILKDTVFGPTMGVVLVVGAYALYRSWRESPGSAAGIAPRGRVVGGVCIAFAGLFVLINAMPGWIFFGWYAYPLLPALVAALVFIGERGPRWIADLRGRVAVAAVAVTAGPLLALVYFSEHALLWSVSDNGILAMSFDLADHVRDRDGRYAMGAMAGMAAYVIDRPVVQLEGLIADRAMVEHIRNRDRLGDVLRSYGVDYLIVSLAYESPQKHDGCYVITQPDKVWAGNWTAKMSGEVCSEPVEHFFTVGPKHPWAEFPNIETLVFDVRHATWR